jgi:hypothetical protein
LLAERLLTQPRGAIGAHIAGRRIARTGVVHR